MHEASPFLHKMTCIFRLPSPWVLTGTKQQRQKEPRDSENFSAPCNMQARACRQAPMLPANAFEIKLEVQGNIKLDSSVARRPPSWGTGPAWRMSRVTHPGCTGRCCPATTPPHCSAASWPAARPQLAAPSRRPGAPVGEAKTACWLSLGPGVRILSHRPLPDHDKFPHIRCD